MKLNKTQARRRGGAQTEDAGRYPAGAGLSVEGTSASLMRTKAQPKQVDLMEAVLERGNLMKAYERVIRNKGASGVDGIGVPEFKEHLNGTGRRSGPDCWRGNIFPRRYVGWTYPSRRAG